MSSIYLTYGTTEGQTAKIAEVVADVLRDRGHDVTITDVKELRGTIPDLYDGMVLGASIHMGKHDKHVVELARENHETLARVPSAFFSVSLAAYGDPPEAEGYVEQFEQETGWRPGTVGIFGGALLYTQYGFVKRHMMKKIASDKPGSLDTDISRDHVYTEWDGVRRFAEGFAAQLELEAAPAG